MNQIESDIQKLVDNIVELVDPIEIILFGSYARGDPNPDSDIDLLVVMPDGTHRRNTMRHLYSNIDFFIVPFDILVANEGDLIEYKDDVGLIYYYALKDGKSIYASGKTQAENL